MQYFHIIEISSVRGATDGAYSFAHTQMMYAMWTYARNSEEIEDFDMEARVDGD